MVDMPTKRGLLAAFCRDALEAHRGGLAVETRYRRATAPDTSRRDRVRVMGDPTYYLEILHSGPRASTVDVNGGAALQYEHTFQVSLFLGYEDAEDYAQSSQAAWDALIEGTSDAAPGLLVAVDTAVTLGSDSERCVFGQVAEVSDEVIPLDLQSAEAAHYLTFQVPIEG